MTTKANHTADPNYTIIIVGDDGKIYRLVEEKWRVDGNVLSDLAGQGIINQLTEFGAYLSFVPPDLAVGIGEVCTVVNLRAILKNNVNPNSGKASSTSTTTDPAKAPSSADHKVSGSR